MIKTYTLAKGTKIHIFKHDWWGMSESYKDVVDDVLDEDIVIRCRDELNVGKMMNLLRKKYNLNKDGYCSYVYSFGDVKKEIDRQFVKIKIGKYDFKDVVVENIPQK